MKIQKSLKIISVVAGVLVLLTVAVFLILASMLLDPKPEITRQQPRPEDISVQSRILGQLLRNFTQRNIPETATLKLTPKEFQSVIRCADLAAKQEIPPSGYKPELCPGFLKLTVPYNTGQQWLFGGWIIGNFSLKISKQQEQLSIEVLNAEIGKFKLSQTKAQTIVDGQLEKLKNHPNYDRFDKLVESIAIDDEGNLILVYRPRNAVFLFKR